MDAGVGPSSAGCRSAASHQPLEDCLEFCLDRAVRRLPLPPREATPVVMYHREKRAGGTCHGRKDATRCHYLTRVIGLTPHGRLSTPPRPDRARQPPIAV